MVMEWARSDLSTGRLYPTTKLRFSTGIGGGSFMNIYDAASGTNVFINSREVAPLDATADMFQGDSDKATTGELNLSYGYRRRSK